MSNKNVRHDGRQETDDTVMKLPLSVIGLVECARYQVEWLQSKQQRLDQLASTNSSARSCMLTEEEEDAIDDGFMICDVNVIRNKLHAWYEMFPRVKPYFALKCNPDPHVARVLARPWPSTDTARCDENVDNATAMLGQIVDRSSADGVHQSRLRHMAGFDCASLSEVRLASSAMKSWIREKNDSQNNGSPTNPHETTDGGDNGRPSSMSSSSVTLDWTNVIYANPQRAEQDLEVALSMGVTALTFDGVEELDKIYAACSKTNVPHDKLQLILRILVPDGYSSVPLGEKFGTPPSHVTTLVNHAISLFRPSVPKLTEEDPRGGYGKGPIVGISFHCGSGCHDPESYVTAITLAREAMDIVDQLQGKEIAEVSPNKSNSSADSQNRCWMLDMGGGYPGWDGIGGDEGRFSGAPLSSPRCLKDADESVTHSHETTLKISRAVNPVLDELFPISNYGDEDGCVNFYGDRGQGGQRLLQQPPMTIISEPGRYFCEAAFGLVSRIYKVTKDAENRYHYTIGHGVQGVFKDVLLCGESFPPISLSMSSAGDAAGEVKYHPSTVHGPSGDELDVVCANCQLPALTVNDYLVFDRMGAYTLSIASRTGRPIIRYVEGGCGD